MDSIDNFISANRKYQRLSKPLTAAHVCEKARALASGRFVVVSFRDGLLTVSAKNSGEAGNLQLEKDSLIKEINEALNKDYVTGIRIKIV